MLKSSHLSHRTIELLLTTLAEEVAQALARGDSYTIPGIGTISTKEYKSYDTVLTSGYGVNASTGVKHIEARRKIKFMASPELMRKIQYLTPSNELKIVR